MANYTARLQSFQNRIRIQGIPGITGIQRAMAIKSWLNLYFFWEKKWFFIALIVGALMLQMPLPEGLSPEGLIILTMSVVSVILYITEPVPLPTVALLIIIGQVVLMGHDSSEVAKSLVTDSVLFIAGSLMLAVAVIKQKLDKRIAWLIVRMTGTETWRVCFGIALVSGFLASFMGEHTVAAMMLPVGITLITLTSEDPKKVRNLAAVVLFSICYG
ncbi:MAG: SLC13 family permease, partial [Rhodospirillales bacterium]